jgi:hypothetical protein
MSGARHRRKGDREERKGIALHKAIGVHAERYPLSGASRFRGSGHDLDIYAFGREAAPLVAEVKARTGADSSSSNDGLANLICSSLNAITPIR